MIPTAIAFLGAYGENSRSGSLSMTGNCQQFRCKRLVSDCRSHQINISLAPGESRDLVFVLGYVENKKDEKWEGLDIKVNRKPAEAMLAKF